MGPSGTDATRPIDVTVCQACSHVDRVSVTVPLARSSAPRTVATARSVPRRRVSARFAYVTSRTPTSSASGAGGASASFGSGSGPNSNRLRPIITVAWPSAMEWCSLSRKAAWPPGRPSTSAASHRGRLWSKSVRLMRRASSSSSRQPAPSGSRYRRRCTSMSKSGSTARRGAESPRAPNSGRMRRAGTNRVSRSIRCRRRAQSGAASRIVRATTVDRIVGSLLAVRKVAASQPRSCVPTKSFTTSRPLP